MLVAATSTATDCALPHCVSLVAASERLGEFAAVLTALTVPAIIFLARKPDEQDSLSEREGLGETQILFLATFISLAIATYLFSLVAAEERDGYRAAFEAFSASLVLSVALQLLVLGVTQLVRIHAVKSTSRFAARINNLFVGPIIFAFMTAAAVNGVELYAQPSQAYQSLTFFVCAGFAAVLVVWMIGCYLVYQRADEPPETVKPPATPWATVVLAIVTIASGFSLVWSEVKWNHAMPAGIYLGFMALFLVATMGYSHQLTAISRMSRS